MRKIYFKLTAIALGFYFGSVDAAKINCDLFPDRPECIRGWPGSPESPEPAPAPLPTRVDLTRYQSPLQSQGGRDTCGTFATAAALEAAYKRNFNVDIDLSEQYLNHWAQAFQIYGKTLPNAENDAGAMGGGGMLRPFDALGRGLGVPPENSLRYIGDGNYQNANEGDNPMVTDYWNVHPQWQIDGFNLADSPRQYIFSPPTVTTTTIMPLNALEQAKYRPTGLTLASSAERRNLDWYRTVLSKNKEIVTEIGSWSHVVLLVGYDDSTRQFRLKNSAGPSYGWLSYDNITSGDIQAAGFVEGVVDPRSQFDVRNNKQLYLGRWNLEIKGLLNGVLDIYSLPTGSGSSYRLGTFFSSDGTSYMYRVNGKISGNRLDFWLDPGPGKRDQPISTGSTNAAVRFTTYLSDPRSMAGSASYGSSNWSVQARK